MVQLDYNWWQVSVGRVCGSLGGCLVVEGLAPLYLAGLKIQQGDLAGESDREGDRLKEVATIVLISVRVNFEGQDFREGRVTHVL